MASSKNTLQEFLQARGLAVPVYRTWCTVQASRGMPSLFMSEVSFMWNGIHEVFSGIEEMSKARAEKSAAEVAVVWVRDQIKDEPESTDMDPTMTIYIDLESVNSQNLPRGPYEVTGFASKKGPIYSMRHGTFWFPVVFADSSAPNAADIAMIMDISMSIALNETFVEPIYIVSKDLQFAPALVDLLRQQDIDARHETSLAFLD